MYPDDRRYSKEHEWVRVEGDQGTIGITDFAQNQLGDVVFLELPEVGTSLKAGDQFGTVGAGGAGHRHFDGYVGLAAGGRQLDLVD